MESGSNPLPLSSQLPEAEMTVHSRAEKTNPVVTCLHDRALRLCDS